jgi:SynChlorMet cassette radical SAM/SPASM protein ScmE
MRHGVPPAVRVTIHRNNVHDLDRVAELLLEDVGLSGFGTNAASYLGLCRKNEDMVQLTAEEQSAAMQTLLELNQKYDNRINALAGPLANAQHWLEMVQARSEGKDGIPGCGYLRSCGGVMNKLNVRADGIMTPCNQMSHIELGRINQDRVRDVWHKHQELERLRERRNIPLSEFEFCEGCEYIPYCRGGCPALAYTITGTDHGPSPDSCLRRFLEAGGTLPDVAPAGAPAKC